MLAPKRVLLTVLAVALVGTASPTLAAHARPHHQQLTCHGLAATLVGSPGAHLVGTEHDDVMVSNGAIHVDASGGDDTVCITGRHPGADKSVRVDGGPGDDHIYVSRHDAVHVFADLGPGTNVYRGGSGVDSVLASTGDDVATRGGHDAVSIDRRSGDGTFRLGGGHDSLTADATSTLEDLPGLVLDGGAGSDSFDLVAVGIAPGSETIDNRHGVQKLDGRPVLRWTSFEGFDLLAESSITFLGSNRNETVSAQAPTVSLHLGGGVDAVNVAGLGSMNGSSVVGGGQTGDALTAELSDPGSSLDIDLPAQELTGTTGATSRVTGFDHVDAYAQTVSMTGNDADETLVGHGCTNTIDGGPGDDHIAWGPPIESTEPETVYGCSTFRATFDGGPGDDTLTGSPGDDSLTGGGADDDAADGAAGTDTCDVEHATNCEA